MRIFSVSQPQYRCLDLQRATATLCRSSCHCSSASLFILGGFDAATIHLRERYAAAESAIILSDAV